MEQVSGMSLPVAVFDEQGWRARLDLGFDSDASGSTRLCSISHEGPLRVQRPFYPEGAKTCHVYILHPPGGMVTGDALKLCINLDERSEAVLTTPSAGKIYRADASERSQYQEVNLEIAAGGCIEWLPQETIVFDGARGELLTRLNLTGNARAALWDIVCLGRPACGELFQEGYLAQNLHIQRDGKSLYRERNVFFGGSDLLHQSWGMSGQPVSGTLLMTVELAAGKIDELREQLQYRLGESGPDKGLLGLSTFDGLLVARYIGPSAEECKHCFEQVWSFVRPDLCGREVHRPRIWNT
jgi:urease accessory protein